MKKAVSDYHSLRLFGAKENNLKNLDLEIKHDSLIAITGLSGSGKSTLAIDTIYAEGGRRYIETFSPYTRQFLDRLHQPKLDGITGVRPSLALEQRNRITSSRSTVGTVTEINDYLKLVWANLADVHCANCGVKIKRNSPRETLKELLQRLDEESSKQLLISFSLEQRGIASTDSLVATLLSEGFTRVFDPNAQAIIKLDSTEPVKLEKNVLVLVDRLLLQNGDSELEFNERALSSINQAFTYGHGQLTAIIERKNGVFQYLTYNESLICNACGEKARLPRPFMFSFNSPLGACPTCKGFGKVLQIDPQLCVPNPNKSIAEGAIVCWDTPATKMELRKLKAFCEGEGISLTTPWQKLPSASVKKILFGNKRGSKFSGVQGWFDRLQRKRHKMHVRVFLSRFRGEFLCPDCNGTRLRTEAAQYRVCGNTLPDIWQLSIGKCADFFRTLRAGNIHERAIDIALEEVIARLEYLVEVGLGYLTLDRQSRTLSGGESQRVNLTSILGSRLVNTLLVLDEPTIGLHERDTQRLIRTVRSLQERGNTVLVVEHDTEMIRAADEVIDIGPASGSHGGQIIYQGTPGGLLGCKESTTAEYLKAHTRLPKEARLLLKSAPRLCVRGARAHNLKNIDVSIPLGAFSVLTGVSGSGKSSFLTKCLVEPFLRREKGSTLAQVAAEPDALFSTIEGSEKVEELVFIDQSPIGKTPRSNPATYSKAWEVIRESLAETEDAQRWGLSKSAFSFNVDGGRCPVCTGAGYLRVEMQFLADVFVECEACGGLRFKDKVLSVRLAGKNVVDLLEMSLEDAVTFFEQLGEEKKAKEVLARLRPLLDLGLGYLRLGHPLSNVSGGEAQRIKIASYLQDDTAAPHIFVLDEPTTGLHPANIEQLLLALRTLVSRGHTVVCVEHNLDVIEQADWIIDLGPEAGEGGGNIVAEGTPRALAENESQFPLSYTAQILSARQRGSSISELAIENQSIRVRLPSASIRAIEIVGARHHNLKDLSLNIPHNTLSVITGVSGSGKSTLAFDIIFAEGQRRYIDCLSPYARQFMKQLTRADVDRVNALPPTIAISQKTSPPLGITTIATTTELYQYLRLLYSKIGIQHCPHDGTEISSFSQSLIAEEIQQRFAGKRVFILAPVVSGRKGYYTELFQRAVRAELTEARIDGKIVKIHPELRLERHKLHWVSLITGSLSSPEKQTELLLEAIDQALLLGGGTLEVLVGDKYGEPHIFSTARVCPKCKRGYRELDPQDFSFRSARGVCGTCEGRGKIEKRGGVFLNCPDCHGARIGPIGRNVKVAGRRIHELSALSAPELLVFVKTLKFPGRVAPIVEPILRELEQRLEIICNVGLDYLRLDRDASTISGGEAQRLRLARTLGSPLTGVCYVLDEPSIGLHPQDHAMLMRTLIALRDAGNTVIVVEHDEETIRAADHIIDIGPVGGANGGHLVAQGSVETIENSPTSITGLALRARNESREHPEKVGLKAKSKNQRYDWLELKGASANNLKNVNLRMPLGAFTVVCGVSGAGKSSLVHGSLVPAILQELSGKRRKKIVGGDTWRALNGGDVLERLVEIDQSPIGRTPTSSPASFLGIFDDIRKIYAALPEARARGWSASHFSFNTGKGRCVDCGGRGFVRVPMSFLPDATAACEACNGLRYTDETLEVRYQGFSIGELLQCTMAQAREVLSNHKNVRRTLEYVDNLGLGYLTLGQPSHTLSGGEAQRLKIAKELGLREATRSLYILDEPTIGLHMIDVDKLLSVLFRLIEKGNTVVVIEHNLDVLRAADFLVEVGPGPGDAGGEILFSGTPLDLVHAKSNSPTREYLAQEPSNQSERALKRSNSSQ